MKKEYLSPQVEILQLASPMNILETFSGTGSVDDFEDGGEVDSANGEGDWFQ